MSAQATTEFESAMTDSVASTPRSEHYSSTTPQRRFRFMCSFGGKILPRPLDNQPRYVGGDTRIVAVNRHSDFKSLLYKLVKVSGTVDISIKYQLPNEELDSLITVSSDEDVENMMEEYDRLIQIEKSARLRLFLFPNDGSRSRATSISSFHGGSPKREQWFLDALNARSIPGPGLERGQSEVSIGLSEMPDYLFGLDQSDDLHQEMKLNITKLVVDEPDPDSPSPSNVIVMPDLPKIKTKPANPVSDRSVLEMKVERTEPMILNQTGFVANNPTWTYPAPASQPIPIYYVPSPIQASNIHVQPITIRAPDPFVQPYHMVPGQVPVGFSHPMPAGIRQVYGGVIPNGVGNNSPMYYGVGSAGLVKPYIVPGGEELQGPETDGKRGWVSQAP